MVVPINENEVARLPMSGGKLAVRFESAADVADQEREFLGNNTLFVATTARAKPFCEFQLVLQLPNGRRCEPFPARLVQLVDMGDRPGLVLQLLQLPETVTREIQNYLKSPSAKVTPANRAGSDRQSLHDRLRAMNPNEKARLASRADRRTRAILMRDHEPKVILFLLKNPQLSRQEALDISRLRTLNHQSIQTLLGNQQWAQSAELRYNLVMNPKTPLQTVLKLLNGLNLKHLRDIAKNQGVREQVKRSALRLVLQRTS